MTKTIVNSESGRTKRIDLKKIQQLIFFDSLSIFKKYAFLSNIIIQCTCCIVNYNFCHLQIMGCLIYASLIEVIVGLTGLIGILLRFIGPLTISVVVSLIGLSLYKIPMIYVRTHWGMSSL